MTGARADAENRDRRGWRRPASVQELEAAIVTVTSLPQTLAGSWQDRLDDYRGKLESGSVRDAAEVVRDLAYVQRRRALGFSEQRLFEIGCQSIESELAFGLGMQPIRARRRLTQLLANARHETGSVR